MNKKTPSEILINATQVTPSEFAEIYEFVLDENLKVVECVHVESLAEGIVAPVDDYLNTLNGVLFELNHVRVNPRIDNTLIISILTQALNRVGVNVHNPPSHDSMALCYRPLGEISENVRFHFDLGGNCTFLSTCAKLMLVKNKSQQISPNSFGKPPY